MPRLKNIAGRLKLPLNGPDIRIDSLNTPFAAKRRELFFILGRDILNRLSELTGSACLIDHSLASDLVRLQLTEKKISFIVSQSPREHLATIIDMFVLQGKKQRGVHRNAVIGKGSEIAKSAYIGPFCVIGRNCRIGPSVTIESNISIGHGVRIGKGSRIHPQVTVYDNTCIGKHVIVHAGSTLGSDGFGYYAKTDCHHKIPHIGKLIIEDNVEIGANCTVDRATIGETRIRRGTKIDNLVQIAHNVIVGEHALIAAQAGIAGSTTIGNRVTIAGQAGLVGHIKVGDTAVIAAQAGVTSHVAAGSTVSGYPARKHSESLRRMAHLSRLPDLEERVEEIWQQMLLWQQTHSRES